MQAKEDYEYPGHGKYPLHRALLFSTNQHESSQMQVDSYSCQLV